MQAVLMGFDVKTLMRFAVANCTFTSGKIISKFEEISTIAVFMCHEELGDELGFDEFDDEIFVMTNLTTKFSS